MNKFSQNIFIILCITFILNQLIELFGIKLFFFHSYLDDLLCFPIILSLILLIQRKWRIKSDYFILPKSHIILSVFVFIIIFELILPRISIKYTADIFDVIAYVLGSIFFLKFLNVMPKAKNNVF